MMSSFLLIAFDGEDVIASLFDDLGGDVLLRSHGVDGDDGVFDLKEFQQFGDGCDLVALFVGFDLSED